MRRAFVGIQPVSYVCLELEGERVTFAIELNFSFDAAGDTSSEVSLDDALLNLNLAHDPQYCLSVEVAKFGGTRGIADGEPDPRRATSLDHELRSAPFALNDEPALEIGVQRSVAGRQRDAPLVGNGEGRCGRSYLTRAMSSDERPTGGGAGKSCALACARVSPSDGVTDCSFMTWGTRA